MNFKRVKKLLSLDMLLVLSLALFSIIINQLLINNTHVVQRFNHLFYDFESTTISHPVDTNIAIVAIDDASLSKLGRWPWSRDIHAQLINQLTDVGVTAIAMDILFMEPDRTSPENDQLLATAIRRNGKVVLPVLTGGNEDHFVAIKPLPEIAEVAELAHVNMQFDFQGIVRQLDLQLPLNDKQFIPAMSLALTRLIAKQNDINRRVNQNRVLINFAGPPGTFQHISYADVLVDKNIQQSLRGKVVLIGVTASGLGSSLSTPVSKKQLLMSGIEFQANAFSTLQSDKIIRPIHWLLYILISLFLILVPVALFRFFRPSQALLLPLVFSVITIVSSAFLLSTFYLWFAPLPTLVCLVLSYPLWSWKKLEQLGHSLFHEHGKAKAALGAIADAVITTDKNGFIEFMNPAAEILLAYSSADVKHKAFSKIFEIIEDSEALKRKDTSFTSGRRQLDIQVIKNRRGDEYTVNIRSNPIYDEKMQVIGIVYAINDLTEISNIHREISFVASHDALTKLPNRILLHDRLEQAIILANRENLNFSILFIDLDGFKKVNDAMGHESGDLLLQEVAKRLGSRIRKSDTISRWGGDEFIILLENLSLPSDAADIAIKIIESLSAVVKINQQDVFITPSIGISLFPEDGTEADILLAKADKAMYNIKKNGRNNFCFYSQKLESQAKERLTLEAELRIALEMDEFEIHYQPQVNLDNNQVIATEALIRWNHPEKGMISPDNFIPFAEEIGLIIPIGERVIKKVCFQLKSWQSQGFPLITVAINLSVHQFSQENLVSMISKEIKRYGLSPELIQVEITESMMINDIDQVIDMLDDFKSAGMTIAIDDFGTGYSSLAYLKRLPIDKLKIDKSFINSILHSVEDANIVQAVISLGHNLKMQIIAEGIENDEQACFLRKNNCDYGQGYLYSKPLTAQKMGGLLKELNLSL